MRGSRWLVSGFAAGMLAACADRQSPVFSATPEPLVESAVAPDGYEAPVYASEASVPPEYSLAEVRSHRERVRWEGSSASGYGSMEYFGNRGRIALEMQVLRGWSTVGTTRTEREQPDLLPAQRVMGIPLSYNLPEDCGQTANLSAVFTARTVLFIDTRITEIGPHIVGGQASATQPACPEPDPCVEDPGEYMNSMSPAPAPGSHAAPDGFLYDPYDPGYESSTTSGCTEGGEGAGGEAESGESFAEMCSSLGGTLYYDYGCIEQYDSNTGQWETIWCGTYAVCET